jgi:tetratricopeptide (TPR) repeat protein
MFTFVCGCGDQSHTGSASSDTPAAGNRPDPARIDASLHAAEDHLNAGDLANAEAILTRLVERAPDDVRGFELLAHTQLSRGVTERAKGDHAGARRHFENAYYQFTRVIELSPGEAGYHQSAGEIAQMLDNDDEALEHYQRARALSPRDPKPALMAAQILVQRDRFDEAEDALQRVLERDPDEPLAHVSLANLRLKQRRYDEALAAVREAREIDPAETSFRLLEATILRQSGRPRAALELLVPLDAEQRARHTVAREIAACYIDLGQPREAARVWGFAYQSNPGHEDAWLAALRAGEAMLDAGEIDTARMWLREARRTAEGRREVEDFAARVRKHADARNAD